MNNSKSLFVYIRLIFIVVNEMVVISIINTTNLEEDGGLGLITNFTAAIIVCELDDLMTTTATVHKYREKYEL
jgi:hypothetical protein